MGNFAPQTPLIVKANVTSGGSERVHQCDVCRYSITRDHAAAVVIKQRGLEQISTQGHWGV
ncbi:MAG: hypothetical protein F6K53_41575 [Moorea sp. SIO4A1]|uniref:hypothetical protein n=1 Tax=Moorena sp. SIO4A1 TaxID=2607835 RepID=UPI0014184312|nr:hypothetical protein [Moorena sp. SIO4A1]NEO42832.1 hypothetical protein [Moorena sp. SIO4A3]NEQ63464.1 hypothetical protein [Moorena sp. SIO4A1]